MAGISMRIRARYDEGSHRSAPSSRGVREASSVPNVRSDGIRTHAPDDGIKISMARI